MKKILVLLFNIIFFSTVSYAASEQISIYKNQKEVLEIPTSSIFYIVDERVTSINIVSGRHMEIYGLNLGKTIVFLWDENNNRHDYVVKVFPKKLNRKTSADINRDKPFRYGVSVGTSMGESTSKYDSNKFKYASNYYTVDAYGNTPYGFFKGQLGYKTRVDSVERVEGISSVLMQLEKGQNKLVFGDQEVGYSDYVVPRQYVQGLSYKTMFGKMNAEFLYGVNKHGWWGSDIFRDHRDDQAMAAMNFSIPLRRRSKVGFNALFKDDDVSGDEAVYGVYTDYKFNRDLSALAEYAVNEDKSASKIGASYYKKGLGLKSTYRNSDKDYSSASDYLSYQGRRGFFNSFRWSTNRAWVVRAKLDEYVDNRFYSGDYNNHDRSAGFDYFYGSWILTYDFWGNARKYDSSTYEGVGHNFQVAHKFGQNRVFYKFTPSNYDAKYDGTDKKTYEQTINLLGIQFKIWKAFVVFEQEYKNRSNDNVVSGNSVTNDDTLSKFRARFTLSDYKLKDRYYLSINGRYENSNGEDELERFYNYIKARIDYRCASDKKMYVEYARTETIANPSEELDKVLQELKLGVTWFWDTNYKYTGRNNMISGMVYFDENGNGEADADEEGIAGATVIVNDKEYKTDINGQYVIKGITQESAKIKLDVTSLPTGYALTTPAKYNMNMGYSDKVQLDFGTSAFAKIRGLVFVDDNSNFIYDAGETLVESVSITIPGITESKSDSTGTVIFNNVPAGEQQFRLNVHTIPSDMLPAAELTQDRKITPGEKAVIYFPLKYNN